MRNSQAELDQLRARVSCATILERAIPPWRLDRAESSKNCLKYRREAGEIIIVNRQGAGWWDPNSEAKGDVFTLVQFLEPGLNFGEVRKALRPLAGIQPECAPVEKMKPRRNATLPIADRWAQKPPLRKNSHSWRYLARRGLPDPVLLLAARCDVIREGPYGSAWFAHRVAGVVTHIDVRGPTYKGSLTGGCKSLFTLPHDPTGRAASSWRKPRSTRSAARRWKICATTRFTPQPAAGWGQPPLKPSRTIYARSPPCPARSSKARPTPISPETATPSAIARSRVKPALRSFAAVRRTTRIGTTSSSPNLKETCNETRTHRATASARLHPVSVRPQIQSARSPSRQLDQRRPRLQSRPHPEMGRRDQMEPPAVRRTTQSARIAHRRDGTGTDAPGSY